MNSTDARIIEMRRKQQEAANAAEQAKQRAVQAQKSVADKRRDLSEKWISDTHVIKTSIDSLTEKLVPEGALFSWQAKPGNPGTSLGTAEFHCTVNGGIDRKMGFNVFENGEIRVYFDGQRPNSSDSFNLPDATQETYEAKLLDLFERAAA